MVNRCYAIDRYPYIYNRDGTEIHCLKVSTAKQLSPSRSSAFLLLFHMLKYVKVVIFVSLGTWLSLKASVFEKSLPLGIDKQLRAASLPGCNHGSDGC